MTAADVRGAAVGRLVAGPRIPLRWDYHQSAICPLPLWHLLAPGDEVVVAGTASRGGWNTWLNVFNKRSDSGIACNMAESCRALAACLTAAGFDVPEWPGAAS